MHRRPGGVLEVEAQGRESATMRVITARGPRLPHEYCTAEPHRMPWHVVLLSLGVPSRG